MKKIFIGALFLSLFLVACNANTGPQEYSYSFGDEVEFQTHTIIGDKVNDTYKIKVSNYRVEQNIAEWDQLNEEKEYVALDLVIENIGNEDSNPYTFGSANFKFYDNNGMEINSFALQEAVVEQFDYAALRPGGKNEGTIFWQIDKGEAEKITEIVISEGGKTGDTFVIKLN